MNILLAAATAVMLMVSVSANDRGMITTITGITIGEMTVMTMGQVISTEK